MILRAFVRQRLLLQFTLLLGALLVSALAALFMMRTAVAQSQALDHARVLATLVEAVGNWSSQYRGVWVLSDPTDAEFQVGEFLDHKQARPIGQVERLDAHTTSGAPSPSAPLGAVDIAQTGGQFHRKAPSNVQRELSEVLAKLGGGERFRVTSTRLFDPRNTPNRFELTAIEQFRAGDAVQNEYHEIAGDRLVYAKGLTATPDCLRCHDTPEKGPEAMRIKYADAQGWGMKVGGFAGIVSVSVPIKTSDASAVFGQLNGPTWLAIIACLAAFGGLLYWLQANVIHAAQVLEDYAQRILDAKAGVQVARIDLDSDEITSHNELHKLSVAVKALYRALQLAQADRI